MAAIEKLYLKESENSEFYEWCGKVRPSLRDKMVCHHQDMNWEENMPQYVALFSEEEDRFILLYCPYHYIVRQIMFQYDLNHIKDVIEFLNSDIEKD
jgi:hypothetical protein